MPKVIHVHLLHTKENFYFGSISAVYDRLTEEQVGMTLETMRHCGLTDGVCKLTKTAMIIQSTLFRHGDNPATYKGTGPSRHEMRSRKKRVPVQEICKGDKK